VALGLLLPPLWRYQTPLLLLLQWLLQWVLLVEGV
jgi:hypothetical protein